MSPPIHNPEAGSVLETPRGGIYRRVNTERPAVTTNRSDSVDIQKVKLSLRDWLLAAVGFTVYALSTFAWIENRMGAIEKVAIAHHSTLQEHERRIAENSTTNTTILNKQSDKLDKLSEAVNSLAVSVAELAARNKQAQDRN